MGTGDGRYPLFVARAMRDTFVIGIDPSIDGLAYAGRRAVREPLTNLLLLVGEAESTPESLHAKADEVRVHLPWGPLLRGCLGDDDVVLGSVARLLRPGGTLTVLLSVIDRDGLAMDLDASRLAALPARYALHGLIVIEQRSAMRADVAEAHSSWGKRLDIGRSRPGIVVRSRRGT